MVIANQSHSDADHVSYKLVSSWVCSETGETPHAKVVIMIDGKEVTGEADGGGSVDAVYSAIKSIVPESGVLELYSVNNVTNGTDAQGEVNVRLEKDGRFVYGKGVDTDIILASAKAYLDALNKLAVSIDREHSQDNGI